jgi:hypothetical protein
VGTALTLKTHHNTTDTESPRAQETTNQDTQEKGIRPPTPTPIAGSATGPTPPKAAATAALEARLQVSVRQNPTTPLPNTQRRSSQNKAEPPVIIFTDPMEIDKTPRP